MPFGNFPISISTEAYILLNGQFSPVKTAQT